MCVREKAITAWDTLKLWVQAEMVVGNKTSGILKKGELNYRTSFTNPW